MFEDRAVNVDNCLLNLLPVKELEVFLTQCDLVELKLGQILANPGEPIAYAYFPLSGIISLEKQIIGSPFLAVMLIGNEGMLCISLNLDISQTPCRAVVQKEGFAWRLSAEKFKDKLERSPGLMTVLKRYTFVVYSQLLQYGVCNLFHVLESRLARIFLMLQDRANGDELHITQELLAQMLGVRRVGVTKAASALQRKNIIRYSRGHISILDTKRLKQQSCVCYEADKEVYIQSLYALVKENPKQIINI